MVDPSWLPKWFSELSGRKRFIMAVVAGLLAGTGQIPVPHPFGMLGTGVAFVGFLLFYLLSAPSRPGWDAFRVGWAAGTAYFAVALHWIVEPFLVDVARHGWMAPFALVFLSGGLALFWGAAIWLTRRIADTPFAIALAWAASLTLAEFARGHVFTGFPWALIGYVWIDTEFRDFASVAGPYGLTLATTLFFAMWGLSGTLFIEEDDWSFKPRLPKRTATRAAVVGFVAVFIALSLGGKWSGEPQEPANITVRLIQPNAPQDEKWDPEKVNTFFHRQLRFTAAPAETRPDIILWPETAIPWNLSQADDAIAMIADAAGGVPVVFGANRRDGTLAYNSLAVLGADGEVSHTYDKHHLVPFGEYIPLGGLAKLIGLRSFASRDGYGFTPGPGPRILDLGPLGKTLPLICYEAIFPANLLNAPERPNWIMQITNDAWFGDIAGPQQHLVQARFRAIEQGLPLVRVANTGISAVIDPWGRVTASIPLGQEGFLDAELPPPLSPTLYARTGNSLTILSLLFLFAAALMLQRRNSH